MNIRELDECQGLTAEMLQAWAEARGWRYRTSGLQVPKGGFVSFSNPIGPQAMDWVLEQIARREQRSIQAVLRDVNPRMRDGWPSEAAIAAHSGKWLAQRGDDLAMAIGAMERRYGEYVLVFDIGRAHIRSADADHWRVWPVDGHGNKVRWTEKDGVMP